jgi:DNA-binding transcriptional ArsR family regulator
MSRVRRKHPSEDLECRRGVGRRSRRRTASRRPRRTDNVDRPCSNRRACRRTSLDRSPQSQAVSRSAVPQSTERRRERQALYFLVENERCHVRIPKLDRRDTDARRNRRVGRVGAGAVKGIRILRGGIVVWIRDVARRARGIRGAASRLPRLDVRQLAVSGELLPSDFLGIGKKQNLTHHLRVLRDAALLCAHYQGRHKVRAI